jgi:hypothetical protein
MKWTYHKYHRKNKNWNNKQEIPKRLSTDVFQMGAIEYLHLNVNTIHAFSLGTLSLSPTLIIQNSEVNNVYNEIIIYRAIIKSSVRQVNTYLQQMRR